MRAAFSLAAAALASMTPALAAACPYCASQGNSGNGQTIALGAFLTLPFLVTGAIFKIMRSEGAASARADRSELDTTSSKLNKTSNQDGSRRIAE